MSFRDRTDAGRQLAGRLAARLGPRGHGDVVVVALPRGGVPVAAPIARALDVPLDVILVRKLGLPFQPEYAMGAIGEGDVTVLNDDVIDRMSITLDSVADVVRRERAELARRVDRYRSGRPATSLDGRSVVLVDDGMATGSTAAAACDVARRLGATRVTVAVPVASPEAVELVRSRADDVVSLEIPCGFRSVGEHYEDFAQVDDELVLALLDELAGDDDAWRSYPIGV